MPSAYKDEEKRTRERNGDENGETDAREEPFNHRSLNRVQLPGSPDEPRDEPEGTQVRKPVLRTERERATERQRTNKKIKKPK